MSQKGNGRAFGGREKNEPTQLALVMEQVEGKSLRALKCFHWLTEPSPSPFAVLLNHIHLLRVESRPVGKTDNCVGVNRPFIR